jgi:hypothetical protein
MPRLFEQDIAAACHLNLGAVLFFGSTLAALITGTWLPGATSAGIITFA